MRRDGRLSVSEERTLYSALKIIEECAYVWSDKMGDVADVASEAVEAMKAFISVADND
jgi:hypothetical protein